MARDRNAGYTPGQDVADRADCAASEFFKDGKYHLVRRRSMKLSLPQWSTTSPTLGRPVPDRQIEDGMAEATGTAGRS